MAEQRRNLLDYPRVPRSTQERRSESCLRKNLLLSQKDETFGTPLAVISFFSLRPNGTL